MANSLILFASSILAVLSVASSLEMSQPEKDQMLNLHNDARRQVGDASDMIELTWDDDLEKDAQDYADTCPSGHAQGTGQGENLAWGWPSRDVPSAMNGWVDQERPYYNYDLDEWCAGGFSNCGHYTQIIWAKTSRVGCARRSACTNMLGVASPGDVYVCRYKRQGNVEGQRTHNRGVQCTECPSDYGRCNLGLCSARSGLSTITTPSLPSTCAPCPVCPPQQVIASGGCRFGPTISFAFFTYVLQRFFGKLY